ncbi:aminoacyl-tRNA hydrolase [[Clostridium] colinum]|uniref:aminoacyl-tRNA hydrolase n=1 Tax=[Clostridium] colinum TaxID=36835 RepID=UPI0020245CB3|nr:aminoacyl-tRNA hydrolase [[Clostridium] colinum]
MKLIIGLGNPGNEYKWTRHNVGFETIDKLAYDFNINVNKSKFKSIYGEDIIHGEKVILIKPLTYMNLSGECVREFLNFYKDISLSDIMVICDDVNLPIGSIRIRKKGSDGGQNGLKNIIYHLNSDEFPRLRIGVGQKPNHYTLANFVLSKFNKEEENDIINGITYAADAINIFIKDKENGLSNAMNLFNKKIKKGE